MKTLLKSFAFGAILALSSCQDQEASSTLASVGDTAIDEASFRYWWDRKNLNDTNPEARTGLLEELIEREAMVKQAVALGLDEDPEVQEEFRSLLISRLKTQELASAASPEEKELRKLYQSHSHEFTSSRRKQVAVLWLNTRGLDPLLFRYRKRLEEVRKQIEAAPLKRSAGFGSHARNNTEHLGSRYKGGVIGWLKLDAPLDDWRTEIADIASKLEVGETSEVITRPSGVYLVRLMAEEDARVRSFEEVHDQLVAQWRREERERLQNAFHTRIHQDLRITRHPERLENLGNLPEARTSAAIQH